MKMKAAQNKFCMNVYESSRLIQYIALRGMEKHPHLFSRTAKVNYGGHFPGGGVYQQIGHFRQICLNKEFKMYDYDFRKPLKQRGENMRRYGQHEPP